MTFIFNYPSLTVNLRNLWHIVGLNFGELLTNPMPTFNFQSNWNLIFWPRSEHKKGNVLWRSGDRSALNFSKRDPVVRGVILNASATRVWVHNKSNLRVYPTTLSLFHPFKSKVNENTMTMQLQLHYLHEEHIRCGGVIKEQSPNRATIL